MPSLSPKIQVEQCGGVVLSKQQKLYLLTSCPDFVLECMQYGANHMLQQLLNQDLVKKDPKTGKRPNRAACHPVILQSFKRDIELKLEVPNG